MLSSGKAEHSPTSASNELRQRRLLLTLVWLVATLAGLAVVAFHLPPVMNFKSIIVVLILLTTALGFYLALQSLLRGAFSLMLYGLFSPALVATISALAALDVSSDATAAELILPVSIHLNLVVMLVWAAAETAIMNRNRTVARTAYNALLSRFRLLDLFILTTLAAISLAAYKLLSNQPIDFWLVVYAQSVFMSIGALVTAFIVIQLSIQE